MSGYDFSLISVLVCDDSYYIRSLVKNFLMGFGVRDVYDAGDAQEGFEAFIEHQPDLVITDWQMGETSGLDLVYLIRWSEKSPNPFVPIIMLTGFTERERVEEARDAGVSGYLAKPLSAEQLYKRLCKLIDDRRAFVKQGDYFGPDRRVHASKGFSGEERRRSG